MNLTRDRVQSIGWVFVLTVCAGLTAGLTLRVNAVKSEVHEAEVQIVRIKQNIAMLETEYQTRANQHQLKALNDVEFGYSAPMAAQYIEGERQLAALGQPRGPGAPSPIRVATVLQARDSGERGQIMAMVSPIAGIIDSAEAASIPLSSTSATSASASSRSGDATRAAKLGERLARIDPVEAGEE